MAQAQPAANRPAAAVSEADLVIVVGSKLGASDTARENPALLDAARGGDARAFEALFAPDMDLAWRMACRVAGDASVADDALQEAEREEDDDGRDRRGRHGPDQFLHRCADGGPAVGR